jgi:hypothetical protein
MCSATWPGLSLLIDNRVGVSAAWCWCPVLALQGREPLWSTILGRSYLRMFKDSLVLAPSKTIEVVSIWQGFGTVVRRCIGAPSEMWHLLRCMREEMGGVAPFFVHSHIGFYFLQEDCLGRAKWGGFFVRELASLLSIVMIVGDVHRGASPLSARAGACRRCEAECDRCLQRGSLVSLLLLSLVFPHGRSIAIAVG